jgi:glucokinase
VPNLVAVDLGGTSIRAAHFAAVGPRPSIQVKIPTQPTSGREAVIGRMIGAIEEVAAESQDDLRIGVGAPGPLDPHRGVILEAPNLPGWIDVPLQAILTEHFHCPVALGNDANLAGLGEWRFGAGQGSHDLLYLTLSTGIGGAVIAADHLLVGFRGLATELGHMTVDPDGPMCGCGHPGHLEALASGPAIARRALELLEAGHPSLLSEHADSPGGLTAEAIGQAAIAGDLLARRVISEAGEAIGRHLANLVHAFNPEVIVLGGGVSRIGPLLFDPLQRALRAHVMHPSYLEDLRLEPAALGDDAGLIGAMVLASEL